MTLPPPLPPPPLLPLLPSSPPPPPPSCGDDCVMSQPPVSLSTFLLQTLPISTPKCPAPNPMPMLVSLPLDTAGSKHCTLLASLLRNDINTITVELRAGFVVINATPLTFDLIEPCLKPAEGEGEEGCGMELGPSKATPLCQNEVCNQDHVILTLA